VILTFARQALTGEDLTVHGDGQQTRSFCYVSDLIDGLASLMDSDVDTPVNIGNPDERTTMGLAEMIIDLTDSESGVTHESRPTQDPQVRGLDIEKARSQLDWEPEVSLRDGLKRSLEYSESAL
jgi:dTDP-glucose 4,6-dehydratase